MFFLLQISCQECQKGDVLHLSNQVKMKCKNGVWVPREKRAGPGAPPCIDNPALVANGICSANAKEGHCNQFTVKGKEMDRDCPGTCGEITRVKISVTPFFLSASCDTCS